MSSASISDTLRKYPPFDRFEPEALAFIDQHLVKADFPAAATLVSPEQGKPESLYIVASGRVRASGHAATGAEFELGVGECFPIGALSGDRPAAYFFTAATDVEAYLLPAAEFRRLLDISPVFARHCSRYLANLVNLSLQQMQAHLSQQASQQQSLSAPLRSMLKRQPVSVSAATPILRAVEIMAEQKIGSVIVVDDRAAPIGLLTQSDVVRRVVLGGIPLGRPISEAMSPNPVTLADGDSAYDAMFAMASRGIRHLLVTDADGQLSGVISERDLFALQRVGLGQVRRAIDSAQNVEELQHALGDVRLSAFNMLAQGVGAEQLTKFISTLNDAATARVLEMNVVRHPLDDVAWTWLAFGSEGREEQTLATDQDNGIVFLPAVEADTEATRQRLLAFAQDVNRDLDSCGFPLCKGNIMAGNPEWCMTLDEWKNRFSSWIRNPHPEALLNATIFFDFRPIYGRGELADRMHEHLFSLSRKDQAFQKMLAVNAMLVAPPLGLIRDFVTEDDEETGKAYIDLKKSGARLFVDAARVMALAEGVKPASTVARLRSTAKHGSEGIEAMVDAFNFIQLLRLRHQHLENGLGRPGDNRVFIGRLNHLDRRILKEAFRQARKLQQRLKLNYQI
ncbi:MAG: CBS domain-containing protein [Gammaproteobacteria bacterium]|nr:CBS domain-containing protein [Gammaproteobacteria bacterium]MBU1415708.1 CBS domain-containing protein [Gammaproteobacteria bacterium]